MEHPLGFILVEKYAYHTPKNRIKRKLRELVGVVDPQTNIAEYISSVR